MQRDSCRRAPIVSSVNNIGPVGRFIQRFLSCPTAASSCRAVRRGRDAYAPTRNCALAKSA